MAPSIVADPSAAGAAFLGAPALGNNNLGNNNLAAMQRRKGAAKRAAAATGGAAGPMEPEPEPDEEEEDTSTRGKARLTMMEEVLLLGLKDEGYTSFWNDSISYGLRGCILAELMLRGRIKCVKAKLPLEEKKLEVVDTSKTGDRILDEVLEVMATSASRAHSCGYWVDVLSGESWNVMKLKFSIKNLRERLAKGLVDKGVLGTESQSFGLFEMATHPLKDASVKEEVVFRVQDTLLRGTSANPREVVLCAMAYACNVIDNVLNKLEDHRQEIAEEKLQRFLNSWPQAAADRDPDNEALAALVSFFASKDNSFFGL